MNYIHCVFTFLQACTRCKRRIVFLCTFLGLKRSHFSSWFEPIPSYVTARGPRAIAAYQRAKATGKTFDRRVKVLLIGQDRVGKTSVVRSLKGEPFRANETSTDGVQMHVPLKNPGVRPWKFCTMQGETTAYHHKCAEYIGRELLAEAKAEETRAYEEFVNTFPRPTKRPRSTDRLSLDSLDLIVDLTGLKRVFQDLLNYNLFVCCCCCCCGIGIHSMWVSPSHTLFRRYTRLPLRLIRPK